MATGPFLCLALIGCNPSSEPSAEQSRQLDNAEAMLNSATGELSNIDAAELEEPAPANAD